MEVSLRVTEHKEEDWWGERQEVTKQDKWECFHQG